MAGKHLCFAELKECGNNLLLERQAPELVYRRARMLLVGLGLLDISRIIDFREPILKSLEGRAQGSLARRSGCITLDNNDL